MPNPIVIAHHLIWTCYGWWLPNDPRGSFSRTIATDILADLGEIHLGRKKVQPVSAIIRRFYDQAQDLLEYDRLKFAKEEVAAIARAFAEVIRVERYTCYACEIMPDHVHILIRKHKHLAEEMMQHLKDAAFFAVRSTGLRPPDHPVWTAGSGWKVFLDTPEDIRRTIKYVDDNPIKARLPRQKWDFVAPYDGWPLHPGHKPNSPYARRLRGER